MIKEILFLFKTQTAKDVSVVAVATGISSIFAAVFFILAVRLLGPTSFGIFSLATAASFMFADIFDIALNTSLVRFVAKELNRGEGEELKYLKFIFKAKFIIGLILIAVVTIIAVPFSSLLFAQVFPKALILAAVGTSFQLLYTFGLSHLQARRQFIKAAAGIIALPAIRLFGLLLLIALKTVEVISTLLVYFFTIPFATLATILLAPRDFFKAQKENTIAKKVLKYNLPITVGFALAAVSGRIDNFILANLVGTKAVGFYAAAFRLFMPAQFLAGSLSTVFAPRFASFENSDKAKTYLKKSIAAIAFLSGGLLVAIPLAPFIVKLFYGSEYEPSVVIVKLLTLGFAALLLQVPFTSTLLYHLAKTHVFAYVTAVQIVLVISANVILIPYLQENGAAVAFILTQVTVLTILVLVTLTKLKSEIKE